jgi:molybdopterin adenylyltransferase
MIAVGVLTLSDKGSRGERVDTSGPAVGEVVASIGGAVRRSALLPDDLDGIAELLRAWADAGDLDLILTTGGTGLAPRDVTPEATLRVVDRIVPGLAEVMRAEGLRQTVMASLSRGVAGVRGRTLIVNLPGSEKGVRESLTAILPVLPHAVETLRGAAGDHVTTPAGVEPAAAPDRP